MLAQTIRRGEQLSAFDVMRRCWDGEPPLRITAGCDVQPKPGSKKCVDSHCQRPWCSGASKRARRSEFWRSERAPRPYFVKDNERVGYRPDRCASADRLGRVCSPRVLALLIGDVTWTLLDYSLQFVFLQPFACNRCWPSGPLQSSAMSYSSFTELEHNSRQSCFFTRSCCLSTDGR